MPLLAPVTMATCPARPRSMIRGLARASQASTASATSCQPLSMVSECPRPSNCLQLGDGGGVAVLLERGAGDDVGDGVVLEAGDQQQRAPRARCRCRRRPPSAVEKLAAAAWNSGRAGDGMVHCSYRRVRLLLRSARCRSRSGTPSASARRPWCGWPGCRGRGGRRGAGPAAAGSTPLIWAGSMATAAAPLPWPSSFSAMSPPNECPMRMGACGSPSMIDGVVVGHVVDADAGHRLGVLAGVRPRCRPPAASRARSGRSRPARKASTQGLQLVAWSHRPWMKTTGVLAAGHDVLRRPETVDPDGRAAGREAVAHQRLPRPSVAVQDPFRTDR